MLPPTLWVEMIIAGFVYLLTGVFFLLNRAQIYDFQFMTALKDYIGLVSLLVIFVSYALGMLMHRLIQMFVLRPLNVLLRKMKIDFNVLGDVRPDYYLMNFILYQYGAQYLQREIDLQFSAFALFMSLIFSVPLLGISLASWLSNTTAKDWTSVVLSIAFVFSFLFLIAAHRQRKHFNGIRDVAFDELMKIHNKTLRGM